MKKVLIAFVISAGALAGERSLFCNYVISSKEDTTGLSERVEIISETESREIRFESKIVPEVALIANFSARLRSVDTHIVDKRTGVEAMGLDFFNSDAKEAGSAVSLSNAQGEYFMLACSVH